MRSLLIVSMLCSLACAAEEDVVIGDYVIPSHNELRAGIPGDYRRLFYANIGASYSNVVSLPPEIATTPTWTEVFNNQSFQNLRLRSMGGIAGGADFPVTSAAADSFTVGNFSVGSFDWYNTTDMSGATELVELWTLKKLFPTDWPNGVQVFFCDSSTGINPSATRSYTLFNGSWYNLANGQPEDSIVPPSSSFIIRNTTSSTIHWLFAGRTRITPMRALITKTAPTGTEQDFWVSDGTGYAHSIQDAGWGIYAGQRVYGFGSAGAYNSSSNTANVFSNTNVWQWLIGGTPGTTSQFSIIPGEGYVFRIPASVPQDTFLIFTP